MALCKAAGVPNEVIASSRRADPKCGRPRTMAAIPFERVDRFLEVVQVPPEPPVVRP